jgi:TolB-like protein/class 3 adenylate cyclase/Flp pilus assembly protein TadD
MDHINSQNIKRKLAAILSADVEGYSRLMGDNEVSTIRTLTAYKEAMTALIQQYRGRVVDAPGDNLLAEFASVVDAVTCAVEIQRELAGRNAELPENSRMTFRIGVNLGDVVEEEDRIYGDGVNITARLECICEGGDVCISGTAFEHVENKLDLEYEDLGEHEVKNITKPVQVYRVLSYPGAAAPRVIRAKKTVSKKWRKVALASAAVLVIVVGAVLIRNYYLRPTPYVEPASLEKMAYPLPEIPSIAVLPFENLSSDPNQEYFSDGMTEQIITALSVVPNLFVIARQSTFAYKGKPVKIQQIAEELGVRYVLEGSIQRSGDSIRLTAQLIDAIKGHHLWAERYDRDLKDIFALQDEITMKIITELQVKLTEGEQARLRAKRTDNLQAYLKLMQGVKHFYTMTKEGNSLARQIFEEVIALDPEFPQAYNLLGATHRLDVLYGSSKSPQKSLEKAMELIQKAIALDDSYPEAHSQLGLLYILKRQHEKAIAECELAVTLSPNGARVHIYIGSALRYAGRHEEAVRYSEKALRLNPNPPGLYFWNLAAAYIHMRKYEEAIAMCKKALDRTPNDLFAHLTAAAAYSQAGRESEAIAEVAEVLRINPRYSLKNMMSLPYKNEADKEVIVTTLRKAGLPEHPPLQLPDKPSIAVLPFDNLSNNPEQEYFSDGMTDDLITDLSKISGLFVIARSSIFQYKGQSVDVKKVSQELGVLYVLEGSVRRAGDNIRINAQLIDATTGGHLWAERYDRDLKDIFSLQDEVTQKIVAALAVKLTEDEQKRLVRKDTDNIEAYDFYLQGAEYQNRYTKEANVQARQMFERAIDLDPEFAAAYARLGFTHFYEWTFDWSQDPQSLEHAFELAQRTLDMDDSLPLGHRLLGKVYLWKKQHEKAITEIEKAIALSPNYADQLVGLGYILNFTGRPEEAIGLVKKAMRLNPIYPADYLWELGHAYFLTGRYEEAIETLKGVLDRNSNFMPAHVYLAASYSEIGREEEARAEAAEIERLRSPQTSLEAEIQRLPYKDQAVLERLFDSLQKAGLK